MTIEEIKFGKDEWEELMFNISIVPPGGDILKMYFSDKKRFEDFHLPIQVNISDRKNKKIVEVNKNEAIKYVMVLYDRNSKYNVTKDPLKMREYAAVCAGWEPDKKTGRFPEYAEVIMRGHSVTVNRMAIRYVRLYYNFEYTTLVNDLISWYKLSYDINGEIFTKNDDDKDRATALNHMQKRKETLEKAIANNMKALLSNDNNPYLKQDLFRMAEDDGDGIVLSPERMAIRGKENVNG